MTAAFGTIASHFFVVHRPDANNTPLSEFVSLNQFKLKATSEQINK